ncbi:NADH-quinone oxidoreductase subunit C [Fluviicola taffensis]|uniref:NADH dehydrogenase subunit C n=1 Tax=Fluviicola taffensis (strain DSM 16823 / NCIMB 13979 / RW262) TaxID=755732 RepID=F2IJQ6_FLUTR|nr:NADH-quinone oxidoreductase subunit C [Fluviicola taffensis]AEA43946.1 NADH dehydrogenase subunit C [Fluviicola taffensis DSM 16823]
MSNLTNETVLARLQEKFGDAIRNHEEPYGLLTIEIQAEKAHDLIAWLKADDVLKMSFLTLIGAVNFPNDKDRELCVNYHIHSLSHNVRLRIRAFLPIENPTIKSIRDIYIGADWQERETYDFFGVIFEGHPNLTRILNEDSMDYFPMRKEYHLEDATREDKDDRYFGR